MLWYTIINPFSLASPPCHCHPHCHCIIHLMIIASLALSFCTRLNPATSSPQSQWQIVLFGGGGRGTTLKPPLQKPIICQLLIVICLLSILSDETLVPPPQESTHHDKDAGGGALRRLSPPMRPPPPPPTPSPGIAPPSPPPLHCSCRAEPWWSATWPMIKPPDAGQSLPCPGASLSLSKVALTGTAWDLAAHRAVGSARGRCQAAEPGAGAETQVLGHDRRCCRVGRNTPASPLDGRWES
jgi:hypothetical protein